MTFGCIKEYIYIQFHCFIFGTHSNVRICMANYYNMCILVLHSIQCVHLHRECMHCIILCFQSVLLHRECMHCSILCFQSVFLDRHCIYRFNLVIQSVLLDKQCTYCIILGIRPRVPLDQDCTVFMHVASLVSFNL